MGIRPGEKIHEEMITSSDSFSTVDIGSLLRDTCPAMARVQKLYQAAGLISKAVAPVLHITLAQILIF